jgi:hypothetical protein
LTGVAGVAEDGNTSNCNSKQQYRVFHHHQYHQGHILWIYSYHKIHLSAKEFASKAFGSPGKVILKENSDVPLKEDVKELTVIGLLLAPAGTVTVIVLAVALMIFPFMPPK